MGGDISSDGFSKIDISVGENTSLPSTTSVRFPRLGERMRLYGGDILRNDTSNDEWRKVNEGMCVECLCRNPECELRSTNQFRSGFIKRRGYEKLVVVNVGFPRYNGEYFNVLDVVSSLRCPNCGSSVRRKDIRRWGFSRCRYFFQTIEMSAKRGSSEMNKSSVYQCCGDEVHWIQQGEGKEYIRVHIFVQKFGVIYREISSCLESSSDYSIEETEMY